ncbi:MAG: MBL fold metallo-hydrolase [Bacteroidia bacterium]|nr:MBL fold metallo-hydrolase [Bacteroidia bacterium]
MLLNILLIIGALALFITLVTVAVTRLSPQFGAPPRGERLRKLKQHPRFSRGKFTSYVPTPANLGPAAMAKAMWEFAKGDKRRQAKPADIPIVKLSPDELKKPHNGPAEIYWFGHSTLLIRMGGKTLLTDPMLGRAPSPFPAMGGKRFNPELPINPEDIPFIDAVLLSHDHYDHLDYGTVLKIKDRVRHWFVALGTAGHLIRWGVPESNITEMDWWDSHEFEGLQFTSVPTRHFTGRIGLDNQRTLWMGFAIKSQQENILFGADSGYFKGFSEIGERLGPFDLTMLECGQYGDAWPYIHMVPEETAQAHLDVKGKTLMPIHWGAFALSLHPWDDSIKRVKAKGKVLGIEFCTPKIGQKVVVGRNYPQEDWWVK